MHDVTQPKAATKVISMLKTIKKIKYSGLFFIWITFIVLLIDRFAKVWILSHLKIYESLEVLPIFNLTLAYNTGAAFSLFHSASGWQNIFLGSLAFIISVIIVYWLYKIPRSEKLESIGLAMILGGAIGNVLDRIQYGSVVDFFDFHLGNWHFAIFNTADTAICLGGFLLIMSWLFRPSSK